MSHTAIETPTACRVAAITGGAGVVAFLASDAAAAVTGQTLCADGGLVLR
jgi:NAD(P)-dependent dehydrogenase (short-subunit alcohol dehydrogenase family)